MTHDRFKAPASDTTILDTFLKRLPGHILDYAGFDFVRAFPPKEGDEYVVYAYKPTVASINSGHEIVRTTDPYQARRYTYMLREHRSALAKLLA